MKQAFLLILAFGIFFSGTFEHSPSRPVVFTYTEPHIEVSLSYEVVKDTLQTPMPTPDVPFTHLRPLRNQRKDEELPIILSKSFACSKANKIAITPHENCHSFREFMKVIDLNMKPIKDTALIYTSQYLFRSVLTKVGNYNDNPNYPYYKFRFLNAADNKLMYILGYVHNFGFVYAKCKVQVGGGQTELREWSLDKINGIPVKTFINSDKAALFRYFELL